ncbi:MAG: hypothetical protein FJX72_10160, partial [Armatimonadetes bacterium]|nr:hypothetical protein [Armatimonadota bacterium]
MGRGERWSISRQGGPTDMLQTALRRPRLPWRSALAALLIVSVAAAHAQSSEPIAPRTALVITRTGRSGRDALPRDAVQALIVANRSAGVSPAATSGWKSPVAGDTVTLPDGSARTWQEITADQPGHFQRQDLAGAYVCVTVQVAKAETMLLDAAGHSVVYVNREPRAGDPYRYGYMRLPVRLRAGANELLFAMSRPELNVRLSLIVAPISINIGDATLPDLILGDREAPYASVIVINASEHPLIGATMEARIGRGRAQKSALPTVPAMSARKVAFRVPVPGSVTTRDAVVSLEVTGGGQRTGALPVKAEIKVGVRAATETHKRTFVSQIDGSVQYYGVVPPRPDADPPAMVYPTPSGGWHSYDFRTSPVSFLTVAGEIYNRARDHDRMIRAQWRPPALTLTCHGAGVEGIGQAASYAPKRGMWIVAPTNRRPYGFDWEEWGRMDALEVLGVAQARYATDAARTYLTGHSMGGHGTWHLGVTFPDRFAAIAPSAGWVSFQSYAGGARYEGATPMESILRRAASGSDTLTLATNLKPLGVYILHGDADDNVPVTEARAMADRLKGFHTDFTLFEQPGAGHWWGAPSDPGTGCVDWPAMFDLFHRRAIPRSDETRHVEFTTMNPGVSSKMRWLTILQQTRPLMPSSASIRCDPVARRFVGTTDNVATLMLDATPFGPGTAVSVELDGTKLEAPLTEHVRTIVLSRQASGWRIAVLPNADQKGPGRAGPFKEAFSNRFVLVYGTGGTPEENAWSMARARYDAETFWYRANGSPDMVADTDFDAKRYRDRSVIVYGHRDMNRAWPALLGTSPVQARRGSVQVGSRDLTGDDLACLFCRPRPDSK